jgi:hypothetical protein
MPDTAIFFHCSISPQRGFTELDKPPQKFRGGRSGKMNERHLGSTTSLVFILPLVLAISGCAVGPKYARPTVDVPTDYRSAEGHAQQASIADLPWWEVFRDERLKELIQTALTNIYDLRIAVSRVEQSRQIAVQARAQFFPSINYSVTSSDGRNELLGTVAPNGGTTGGLLRQQQARPLGGGCLWQDPALKRGCQSSAPLNGRGPARRDDRTGHRCRSVLLRTP